MTLGNNLLVSYTCKLGDMSQNVWRSHLQRSSDVVYIHLTVTSEKTDVLLTSACTLTLAPLLTSFSTVPE